LSERIRPNSEAAPWVIAEVKRLEWELSEAYTELRKQRPTIQQTIITQYGIGPRTRILTHI
jgi:hypothetical protein